MPGDFDPRLVFVKTAAGSAEVAERSHGLSGAQRRILILLDGRRRLADLPPFARPRELEPIIADLATRGLIALAGIADDPSPEEAQAHEERQRAVLVRLRGTLAGAFELELGTDGRILEARLRDCVSLDVLRQLVREAVETIRRARGDAAAERVLDRVRPVYGALVPEAR